MTGPRRTRKAAAASGNRSATAFTLGPPEWKTVAAKGSLGRGAPAVDDARVVLDWYRKLADAIEDGRQRVEGKTPAELAAIAHDLRVHAADLEEMLERTEEVLADRERELPFLRANDTPAHYRKQVAGYGEAFARRMRVERRERIRFLEIEQTRIMVEDVGGSALLHGLALGIIGAWLGIDPAVGMIKDWLAHCERQRSFSLHERGPFPEERRRRNEQIVAWNSELLLYPTGKRRPREEIVRIIHDRLRGVYRDKRAEARYHKDEDAERAAEVWKIGAASIVKLLPTRRKKN